MVRRSNQQMSNMMSATKPCVVPQLTLRGASFARLQRCGRH
jgi:hypothetical protein